MSCPGDETIARFAFGDLEPGLASSVRAHMDSCDACRSLVADVAQDARHDSAPPTRVADSLDVGSILVGKYEILARLGTGGMGIVVAAMHLELGQKVAIKVVHGDSLEDRDTVKRFLREGRAAAKLRSDHAVRIYDVGRLPGGAPFLVMEHLDGDDLAALQRKRRLEVDEAVNYILEAIEVIAEAHSYGLVHRDIKPANLFLARLANGDTRVKVLDFGLAKDLQGLATSSDSNLTTEHMFIGSPMFMSPEQIRDPRSVDRRTDIWSLGATLYQLVTGQPPFSTSSVQSTLAEVCTRALPPPSSIRPGVPRAVDDAIARCMKKEREQRFATVEELAIALGGRLPRSSSRKEIAAPETPKVPATTLMPGVDLDAPTFVEPQRAPAFRETAPMPASPLAIPRVDPSPRSLPTFVTPKRTGMPARTIVLLALVPLVALTMIVGMKLRGSKPSSTTTTSAPSAHPSGVIVVVPVTGPIATSASASPSASASASASAPTKKPAAASVVAKKPPPGATSTTKPAEKDPYDR